MNWAVWDDPVTKTLKPGETEDYDVGGYCTNDVAVNGVGYLIPPDIKTSPHMACRSFTIEVTQNEVKMY